MTVLIKERIILFALRKNIYTVFSLRKKKENVFTNLNFICRKVIAICSKLFFNVLCNKLYIIQSKIYFVEPFIPL